MTTTPKKKHPPKRDRLDVAISYGLYLLERFGDQMPRENFEKLVNSTERRMKRREGR